MALTNSGVLGTNANAHYKSRSKQSLPGLCESGSDWSGGQAGSRNEDLASTAKVVVERVDNKSTAVENVSSLGLHSVIL